MSQPLRSFVTMEMASCLCCEEWFLVLVFFTGWWQYKVSVNYLQITRICFVIIGATSETDNSVQENSSLSISRYIHIFYNFFLTYTFVILKSIWCPFWLFSSTSLSLKTPFVEAQTERRGLQRRVVGKRRKLTEEEFGDAMKGRQAKSKCDYNNKNIWVWILYKYYIDIKKSHV